MTSRRAQRRAHHGTPDEPPRFLRRIFLDGLGELDVFAAGPERGGTLLLVPALNDGWPAEVKNAVERRRRATLYGRCDCGEHRRAMRPGADGMQHASFPHERDCPASDEALGELFAKHGIDPLRRFTR